MWQIGGLPIHPLVVHAAVVLVPLAALGALLVLFSARLRDRYQGLCVGLAWVAAATAVVTRLSGEAFLALLGVGGPAVETHRMWGEWVPYPAVALALLLPAALWLRKRGLVGFLARLLAALAALASLALLLVAGHSGATAVWGGVA